MRKVKTIPLPPPILKPTALFANGFSDLSGDGWLSEEDQDNAHRLGLFSGCGSSIRSTALKSLSKVCRNLPFPSGLLSTAGRRWRWFSIRRKIDFIKPRPGQGAFLNDQAIRVTPRSDIDGAVLLVSRSEPQRKFQMFVDRCEIRPVGSIAYRLAKVAGGDGDGTLTFRTIHEWDICAGVLMVEAGGSVRRR